MANLSKLKREKMLAYIEKLKQEHTDDESLIMFSEIENALLEKKFGLVFEEHTEQVDQLLRKNIPVFVADNDRRLCKDKKLPWNFIIEGDNLQALYLLEKTHRGKVDCIYIDPPYNTGARDWKYNNDYVDGNDTYRHSKWLSMMRKRLKIAEKLLNPKDSVLIVTIDEKEYLHLGCLLEDMFPEENIQMVCNVINPHGANRKNHFARVEEYLYFVFIGDSHVIPQNTDMLHPNVSKEVRWAGLMRQGPIGTHASHPKQFYPIFINKDDGKFHSIGDYLKNDEKKENVVPPDGCIALFPINTKNEEMCWGLLPDSFMEKYKNGYIKFGPWNKEKQYRSISHLQSGTISKIKQGEIKVLGMDIEGTVILDKYDKKVRPVTVWNQALHSASEFGSSLLNKIFPSLRFSYPKSLYAVHDTIKFLVANKPNAIILDFFAGSGTTMHAVNLLNTEDGGHRRCIMVTNNEVSDAEAKELIARGLKPSDEEWEKLGIARYVTWPRTVCSIEGHDVNGKSLKGNYVGSDLPMADGFKANVKYLKCNWVSRNPSEGTLSEALLLHIKEMVELEHSIEIDDQNYLIVLNEEDADKIEAEWDKYLMLKGIYISRNVLLTTKQNELFNKVELHTIPDNYFDIEMKEVGESW